MTNSDLPSSLRYSSDNMAGYYRETNGDAFVGSDENQIEVKDQKTLKRINKLVIPPMWQNVWICKDPKGYIQAVGRDAKGRKQYIYHQLWKEYISEVKYNKLVSFAKGLPKIRKQVQKDLRKRKWTKEKVVALAIRLMDEFFLRVGNKRYEKENGTYGLTTLRKKHLKEVKNGLIIKYKGKSGKFRELNVEHPNLIKLLKQCSELPGYEVFRYKSGNKYVPIDSQDINNYLRRIASQNISAKNFRTWGGTVTTIKLAIKAQELCALNPGRNLQTALIGLVASELNNTVAVCRKYYIHPVILDNIVNNNSEQFQKSLKRKSRSKWLSTEETMVIQLLKAHQVNLDLESVPQLL